MDFDRAREEILNHWEDILKQITSPAKAKVNGHTSYICPLCGHGTHGDGLTLNPKSKDGKGLKCFGSCQFSGDIIALIGEVEHISSYPEKLRRAGELCGVDIYKKENEPQKPAQNQPRNKQYTHTDMNIHTDVYTQTDTEDLVPYYRECQEHLAETDYLSQRGISEEVAKKYMLGYDPNYTQGTGGKIRQALIIPTGRNSYVARNTDPQAGEKDRYRKKGAVIPFNVKALGTATKPIYITEGEIDALSIIEVGGEAIGLGSASIIDKFTNNYLKKQRPAQPLVLALDNDPAGQDATKKLEEKLTELDIPYYIMNPAGEYKDPNEALLADREAFKQEVAQAEHIEDEALTAEKEAYLKTSTDNFLQAFTNGIAESVNTPAQPTGFDKLDNILDGGLYEGLYIIGAITSLGKTTLALQIADQIAETGRDVIIFSLEMARTELMSKSISRITLIRALADSNLTIKDAKTNRGITNGAKYEKYTERERDLIETSIIEYGAYARYLYIHEGVGDIGTDFIRETIEKHKRFTGKDPVILIDYIQILAPHDVRATDKQNTDKAVLELKRISRDFKIPVIGISSFNRASYREEVTLEAFKESGSLEYGSDVLIGLQLKGAGKKDFDSNEAKRKDPREIELVILKNRNGKTGEKIDYKYYPKFNYFMEV